MPTNYATLTPREITELTDGAIAEADRLIDAVAGAAAAQPDGALTFEQTMRPLDAAFAAIAEAEGRGGFLSHVHPDPAVRDAAQRADERTKTWRVQVVFRDDLHAAVVAFSESAEAAALDGEARRFLDFWLRDFRRAGHGLPRDERAELRRLRTRLVELEVEFQRALDEYRDWLDLSREELSGLPDGYIARLGQGDAPGTFRVSLDYPELQPFLEQAERRDLREAMEAKHLNRAVEHNRPILEEALRVRDAIAARLDYPTWADYAIEVRMARKPEAVGRFYADLLPPLADRGRREIERMAGLLEADTGDRIVRSWDWRYYDTQIRRQLGVDPTEVSAHLPLDAVIAGLLDLTSEVFGLAYRRVPDPRAWHPDVRLYEVLDRDSGDVLASFYADLFPREGKYGHAMAVPLVVGHRRPDGSYERPVSAIVANLARPTADQPSLLQHSEVETLFHEFGHVLHMSLSKAQFVRFSGAETEWDFVEAPSQIMEHWAWQPEVLERFARHHRTGERIPADLVDRLAASRDLDEGIRTLRQIFFGKLDLGLHGVTGERDLEAIYREAWAVTGFPFPEGTFLPAAFGHLMGGYDAGYYGYLWSKVFGDDMFGRFAREGVTSAAVGAAYRREILEPNGSRDAIELLRAFLGREPSNEEFLRLRGITPEPATSS